MNPGEIERIRVTNKDGGQFPVYADIERDELGGYTVTVDNEDRPGTFLARSEDVHGEFVWEVDRSGALVFQADSEEEARTTAENEVGMQRDLFERLYEEMPDIDKPTGWEMPDGFGGPPDWELPAGLRGRVMEVGPSKALAEEFGLDYMVALIDVDFAGIPRRSQGDWAATAEHLDAGELAVMDTTPIATFAISPESGRAVLVAVLAHAGEEQQSGTEWRLNAGVRHTVTSHARVYHEDGLGTAFAVRQATTEEIENALLSKPAIRPNRAARRRAKHGRK